MKAMEKKKGKRKFPGSGGGYGGFGGGGYGGGGGGGRGGVSGPYAKPYVYHPSTYIQVPPPEVTTPPEKFVEVGPDGVVAAGLPTPARSNKPEGGICGKPIHAVIQNPNPISALHEYCKKGRL